MCAVIWSPFSVWEGGPAYNACAGLRKQGRVCVCVVGESYVAVRERERERMYVFLHLLFEGLFRHLRILES